MSKTSLATPEEPNDDKSKKPRRNHGEGGLRWSERRQRWIAEITTGYTPAGNRIVRTASDKSKSKALKKLHEKLRDRADGLPSEDARYTVAQAVENWLDHGMANRDEDTCVKCRSLAKNHIIPDLGARKLRDLSADDVDDWLTRKAATLSTDTLRQIRSILKRAVTRAQKRDKVKRNVVLLCEVPQGKGGRPSKSLTLEQASAVLSAAEGTTMYAYIVLSLLIGARTEELRALTWAHVDLDGRPDAEPPAPPCIQVWRSVRAGGKTKTRKSRRTLALPKRCVEALRFQRDLQDRQREAAGDKWQEHGLVFASSVGTARNVNNVLRSFRAVLDKTDLSPDEWTPRELRHSFVSVLSASGVPIEEISRLAGHKSTEVTETVYWHQIRPALLAGAEAMDDVFPLDAESA